MAYVVKRFNRYYGDLMEETYFRNVENVRTKVREIIEDEIENYPHTFDDLIEEDFEGDVDEFIAFVFDDGGWDNFIRWFEIEFEDEFCIKSNF